MKSEMIKDILEYRKNKLLPMQDKFIARRQELEEIDNNCQLDYEYISNLIKSPGKKIIDVGMGSGKTSRARKFIVENYYSTCLS